MKQFLMMALIGCVVTAFSACIAVPPGHDPRGPGNSENAPGHNK